MQSGKEVQECVTRKCRLSEQCLYLIAPLVLHILEADCLCLLAHLYVRHARLNNVANNDLQLNFSRIPHQHVLSLRVIQECLSLLEHFDFLIAFPLRFHRALDNVVDAVDWMRQIGGTYKAYTVSFVTLHLSSKASIYRTVQYHELGTYTVPS